MHFEKFTDFSNKEPETNLRKRVSNSSDKTKIKLQKKIKYNISILKRKAASSKRKQETFTDISLKYPIFFSSKKSKTFQKQIRKKVPWVTKITKEAIKAMKFHFEIFDFLNFISPSQADNNRRLRTYFLVQSLITKRWPTWKVQVYGSFLVNLHLKDSDVDFTVLRSSNMNFSTDNFSDYDDISDYEMLNGIYELLVESKFAESENMRLISAKVPIIKCICAETGIHIDLR